METRSNQILVGSVVLGLIAALAVFIVWLSQMTNSTTAATRPSVMLPTRIWFDLVSIRRRPLPVQRCWPPRDPAAP